MERISNREYRTWMAYYHVKDIEPTLDHHYLMQLTSIVANLLRSKGDTFTKMSDFKLRYTEEESTPLIEPNTPEYFAKIKQKALDNKSIWFTALGVDAEGKPLKR